MFKTPITALKFALAVPAISAVFTGITYAQEGFDAAKEVALPAEAREFVALNPAISMAHAYGNRGTGGHGSFGQFPANFETPLHVHTNAYHGIVIKGQMTNPFEGDQNPPVLGPGSYWYVPAMMQHATACVSDTPCEFYFYADSAFDFVPVE